MKVFQTLFWVVAAVLIADAFFFILWALSGQEPQTGFYFGAMTTNALRAAFY